MADDDVLLSSNLTPTRGFHTSSTTRLVLGSRVRSCTLHLYFDLPTQLFADPYELDHRRASYTFERFGAGNLEAPVFAPGAGGPSGLLLNVTIPEGDRGESREDNEILSIEVPLHARYGVPKTKTDGELIDEVVLPPPEAFWACAEGRVDGDGDGGDQAQVPDALHKVVELAPALKRVSKLVLIPHAEALQAQRLRVPVGNVREVALVETGTVLVVLLTFAYLFRTIVRASRRTKDVAVKIGLAKKDI